MSAPSDVLDRSERPVLEFADYGVAFHLGARQPDEFSNEERVAAEEAHSSPEARALESYERDMLLYAYRHVAPLRTHPVADRSPAEAGVVFPGELAFESEGKPIRLACSGAESGERVRQATVFASRTLFDRSPVTVLTLVLRPRSAGDPLSALNEYDVIKLAKLWEGGERLPEPGSRQEERGPVLIELEGRRTGFGQFAQKFIPDGWSFWAYRGEELASALRTPAVESEEQSSDAESRRHYRVGTIALRLPATDESRELLEDAQAVKELSDGLPGLDSTRWRRVVALGGVMQGLLDFEEIGPAELSDVFAEAQLDDQSLLAFHKGTLLSVEIVGSNRDEERQADLARPIGVSPYLVVPQAVLLHNEQRLKWALIRANELLRGQDRPRRLIGFADARISIDQTERGIRETSEALAQHLPNIFHYEGERALYEGGSKSRGFDDFVPLIRLRLDELRAILESRTHQRDTWTLGFTITFFAIAALQLALTSVPWWGSLLVLGALAVIVWQLRKRLF